MQVCNREWANGKGDTYSMLNLCRKILNQKWPTNELRQLEKINTDITYIGI